jgi:hypothetical protein
MAVQIDETTWDIQGRTLRFPICIRDASAAVAGFIVPSAPVSRLLDGTGLAPVSLAGSSLASVILVDYHESPGNDLGSYAEFGLSLLVRGPDGRTAGYVHQLPVSQAFTREAGVSFWGFPKWLADFDLTIAGPAASCRLSCAGAPILTAAIDAWRFPRLGSFRGKVGCYTSHEGRLRLTTANASAEGVRVRVGGGASVLPSGNHVLAAELRSLGFPRRALFTATAERITAEILPATEIPRQPAMAASA